MATRKIKVIKGTLGYWDGLKVVPKTAKDKPFAVEEDRAVELVKMDVAAFSDADEAREPEGEAVSDSADLENMTLEELKRIAEPYGVKWKVGIGKAELIERIRKAQAEKAETDEETEEEATEEPPAFDAADAVVAE